MTIILVTNVKNDENILFLSFLDVGQGDAIYISYKDTNILIDSGYNYAANRQLNSHMPYYDCRLNYLYLTHSDFDHIGGGARILQQCSVKEIRFNDVGCGSNSCKELSQLLVQNNVENNFNYDFVRVESMILKTLWPPKDYYFEGKISDVNDTSIVQILKYKDFDVLLTGDASFEVLKKIHGDILSEVTGRLEVLKLPHHGSRTGLAASLFMDLDPQYCVISAGKDNTYGHPDPEVMEFIESLNCTILQTKDHGSIEFKVH